jgi:crotonobetainyl-CoA:carnitine CoA-transferase CaiB-like acyl-CoA transferase
MTVLRGVSLLDLASSRAASLASMLLADFGADVVKVTDADHRKEPRGLSPDWLMFNRGKRLALADAASPDGRREVARLAEGCDILVADSREQLALFGLADLAEAGRRIVLLTPPYDGNGTPWAGGGESPELLNAISGLARFQASYAGTPVDSVYPYLTSIQGTWGATCTVAALIERQRSGAGQLVEISGLHAVNVFGGSVYARAESEPDPDRAVGAGGLNPMYTRYRAGDGRWFFIGGLGPKFSSTVVKLTNSEHLLEDPRINGKMEMLWHVDNSRWVIEYFNQLFNGRPAAYWIDLLESGDVPVTLLHDREEWLRNEQVRFAGQRVDVFDPVLGQVAMPGSPVVSGLTPARVRPAAAAKAIEDVRWLMEPAVGGGPTRAESAPGQGPLAGYRVASFGYYVAGPYGAFLLAQLGADVVKVEPLSGDPWRMQGFAYNRGVKSLAIDLQRPGGREAVRAVLRDCDIVLDNFRLGVMARLGIDHEQLSALNPAVLTVAVTAYGEEGPLAAKPGYDPVLQAASGMMTAQGGDDEPVVYSLPPNDHTAGVLGAFASVLALLHRERTGQTQHIATSLTAAATLLQAPDLLSYQRRPAPRVGGRDFRGPAAADHAYPVADGFVRLQATSIEAGRWRAAGLGVDPERLEADPGAEVARVLAGLTAAEAVSRLSAAQVPAVPDRRITSVANDPALHERGLLTRGTSLSGIRYTTVGQIASFSRTPQAVGQDAPGLGEHSRELLAAAGLDSGQIDQLVQDGTVKSEGPLDVVFLPVYR